MASYTSNGSVRTHEVEAVVQTARATSVRSGYSIASADGQKSPEMTRPRLVPFTSASRVPVPKLPVAVDQDSPVLGAAAGGAKTKRVASQVAKIFRGEKKPVQEASADDLNTSVNYVRALGDDGQSAASASIGEFPSFLLLPMSLPSHAPPTPLFFSHLRPTKLEPPQTRHHSHYRERFLFSDEAAPS